MSSRVKLELVEPIQFGSERITELEIRRPKGKDIRALKGDSSMGDTLDLLGKLCGQPKAVIDELDVVDVQRAGEIVAGFYESGPKTGADGAQ